MATTTPFGDRRDLLCAVVADAGLDAALISHLVNVRYLTGFTGSHAALLVTPGGAWLATDGRYQDQAATECPDLELVVTRAVGTSLLERLDRSARVGIEEHHVSVAALERLAGSFAGEIAHLGEAVEALRQVKDEDEIGRLRQACAVSDQALADLLPTLRVGQTERQVAWRLESLMREHGAADRSFETIVATGPHSAIPHHQPTDRPLAAGDFLKIDFGALVEGYHADITRTFVVAGPPSDWQQEVYLAVRAAQRAGVEAMLPDVDPAEPYRAAREVLEQAGVAEWFTHGLGHGVGLEIHEWPFVGPEPVGRLADRTPVTVEPGVYLPGRGGVRIEDTLVVGPHGPESLTRSSRELLVVG